MSTAAGTQAKVDGFYIPSLDGIRAVSFLGVFLSHLAPDRIRVPGPFGVTVFFFLSGYLITTLLRMEFESTGKINLKAFYLRRTLRILPPFYLVLFASSVLALLLGESLGSGVMLTKAFHLANYWIVAHGWDETPPGTTGYWSLAVEEHFYLVFPAIYIAVCRFTANPKRHALVFGMLCALVLAWRMVLVYGFDAPELRTYVASDTRVDSILFGCVLATFGNPVLDGPSRFSPFLWKWLFFPAGCALVVFSFTFHDLGLRETIRYSLQGLGLFPIFIAAVRFPDWGPFRVLNVSWVRFAGVLSYSLYLLHDVVLSALRDHVGLGIVARALVGMPVSVACAYAIYRYVERPCAKLRRRLSRVPHAEPALRTV
jgi:peptidoglycan/LPS O-acetylase OafA/YrhL